MHSYRQGAEQYASNLPAGANDAGSFRSGRDEELQKEVFLYAEKCFKLIGPEEEDDNSKRLSSAASEQQQQK